MVKQLVICAKRYNGHELWTLLRRFQVHGIEFEVLSSQNVIRDELTLQPNTIARTLDDVTPDIMEEFDGVSVVSGNMKDTEAYWDDKRVIGILQRAKALNKVVSAICCSVPTLACVAKGVRVSPFPLVRNKQRLVRHGAILEAVSICVDEEHRVVTAENQMMTYLWADCIAAMLQGRTLDLNFTPTGYAENFKGKTPRRLKPDIEKALTKYRDTPATINKPKP